MASAGKIVSWSNTQLRRILQVEVYSILSLWRRIPHATFDAAIDDVDGHPEAGCSEPDRGDTVSLLVAGCVGTTTHMAHVKWIAPRYNLPGAGHTDCQFPNYLAPSFPRYLAYDAQNDRRQRLRR
jgi:hypothetical protein